MAGGNIAAQQVGQPGLLGNAPTAGGKGGGTAEAPVATGARQNLANSAPPMYQNSGLSRFVGNMNPYQPTPYKPAVFSPGTTSLFKPREQPASVGPSGPSSAASGGQYGNEGGGYNGDGSNAGYMGGGTQGGHASYSTGLTVGNPGKLGAAALAAISGMPLSAAYMAANSGIGYQGEPSTVSGFGGVGVDGSVMGTGGGLGLLGDYGGDYGGGDGPGGSDGQAGDAGNSDAGSTGGGSDTGSDAGQGGDGTGSGGDWSKGGKVTKRRLLGPNPKGPDDGYGSLDVGEIVVPANRAKNLSKKQVRNLIGRRK